MGGEYVQKVLDLEERLDALIPDRRLPYPRWIVTPDGDLGSEWCTDCGYYKVRNLRRHDRKRREDYILDGGWRTEEEHFCYCAGCGTRLDVTLLDGALRDEIYHYTECGFSTKPEEDAYELRELLNVVSYRSDNDKLEAERTALITIATRFLAEQVAIPGADR